LTSALPEGYAGRAATIDDIGDVVTLRTAHDLAVSGRSEPYREFYGWLWGLPYVDLGRDTLLIHDRRGGLGAIGHVAWDPATGGPMQAVGRVHPDHLGRGLGTALIRWSEAAAEGSDGTSPTVLFSSAPAADTTAGQMFLRYGFRHVRNSWDMELALSGSEQAGDPPAEVRVRPFEPGRDERALYEVSEETFAEHFGRRSMPYESFAAEWFDTEDFDPSLMWFAQIEGEIVGFVSAIALESEGYVGSLGVRKPFRGRGIATCLMRQAFAEMAARGFRLATLSVDAGNETGAVELYRKLGMNVRSETHIYSKGSE
jgi:mycothiol synthase